MLSQEQAEILMGLIKVIRSTDPIVFPDPGDKKQLDVEGIDSAEKFIISVYRGRINISKCTYQTRYQNIHPLVRIDIEGSPHPNPDGSMIPCPHIHLYREGYYDSWAYPLDSKLKTNPSDLLQVLSDFLEYNNVNERPIIKYQKGGLV